MFTGRYRLPEEYVPASHSTHAMDASKALYVPAGQSVQFELTAGLMRPAEHVYDAEMLFDAFPASQFRHSMDPATACVPARHIRQNEPRSSCIVPRTRSASLLRLEYFPASQTEQFDSVVSHNVQDSMFLSDKQCNWHCPFH